MLSKQAGRRSGPGSTAGDTEYCHSIATPLLVSVAHLVLRRTCVHSDLGDGDLQDKQISCPVQPIKDVRELFVLLVPSLQ